MKANLRKSAVGLAVVMSFGVAPQSYAGGGGLGAVAGATEFTQLANKGELLTTAINTLQTAEQSLRTAINLERSLVSMPTALLNDLTGGSLREVQRLIQLHGQVKSTMRAYEDADRVMQTFQAGVLKSGYKPSDYLRAQAQIAAQKGGIFRQNYDRNIEVMDRLRTQQDGLSSTIASIPTNALTTVSGLQQVATIGAQTQALTIEVVEQLRVANQMAIEKQRTDTEISAQGLENKALLREAANQTYGITGDRLRADGQLPDPTQMNIVGR